MEYFRFTLFNSITLLMMALTAVVAVHRFRGRHSSNWPLVYYAVLLGYTFGFEGGLRPEMVLAGLGCAVSIRFGFFWKVVRVGELVVLGYVLWRCLGLIMMW
jgi:hypothetical protein